jgi:hypothetical protein
LIIASKRELRSTTLTVTILVVFIVFALRLALARPFRLVLAGLVAVLVLSMLAALLTLLLHIFCHKTFLLRKAREPRRAFGFVANQSLVAARDCKGWEGSLCN